MKLILSIVSLFCLNLVSGKKCGIQRVSNSAEEFIVGGDDAKHGEFPWFVEMKYKPNRTADWEQGCGGALIADNWVLTAGHCAMADPKDDPELYTAFVDVTDLNSIELSKQQVKVLKVGFSNINKI